MDVVIVSIAVCVLYAVFLYGYTRRIWSLSGKDGHMWSKALSRGLAIFVSICFSKFFINSPVVVFVYVLFGLAFIAFAASYIGHPALYKGDWINKAKRVQNTLTELLCATGFVAWLCMIASSRHI